MKQRTILLIVLAVAVAFTAFWVIGTNKANAPKETSSSNSSVAKSSSSSSAANSSSPTSKVKAACAVVANPIITYQKGAFTPDCVTVKSGDSVTFVNKNSQELQIGADPHPSHSGNREVTGGEFTLNVPTNGQSTSILTTKGDHSFHNHQYPQVIGKIVVQ